MYVIHSRRDGVIRSFSSGQRVGQASYHCFLVVLTGTSVLGLIPCVSTGKGETPMLTISAIATALANPAADNSSNNAIIVIGIVFLFILLVGAVSSGNSAKKLIHKYYCPHCHKQVSYMSLQQKPAFSQSRQGRNQRFVRQSRPITPRINAPVVRSNGRLYCPYCHKPIFL